MDKQYKESDTKTNNSRLVRVKETEKEKKETKIGSVMKKSFVDFNTPKSQMIIKNEIEIKTKLKAMSNSKEEKNNTKLIVRISFSS